MKSDIEIARAAEKLPIAEIAKKLNLNEDDIVQYGKDKAKIASHIFAEGLPETNSKLVLVSALSPTRAGEGKTTMTIGLGDALCKIGKKTTICLREPSLGPCFGMKGGAAGGGLSQVVPMENINLHFTGDFHAISLAHNLLSAIIDNHIHQGNKLNIDPRRVVWKRVVDMNDRALRNIAIGLGGPAHSIPRESGFDISVASEVMAIMCLSTSLADLKRRLGRVVIGYTYDKNPITAADLKVHGAMTVLLKDAFYPNLVQTLEHTPALVHGGPFANIAHGCNSVIATKFAMSCSQYTVTEAGFGADLGAEKFINIKCRKAGLKPDVVVLVATVRALKLHGGMAADNLTTENVQAVQEGLENLIKHIENIHSFHLPVVVAINTFESDTEAEITLIKDKCDYLGVPVIQTNNWAEGGAGAIDLAENVVDIAENHKTDFKLSYPDEMGLLDKVSCIAKNVYGADGIIISSKIRKEFEQLEQSGYGNLPICMAKTQYSFSADQTLRGRPRGFDIPITDVHLAAGAGFVIVITNSIMTMPGLPRVPAAEFIDINDEGEVIGLF